MNRRTFLTALGAALTLQALPKQLLAANLLPSDLNIYQTVDLRIYQTVDLRIYQAVDLRADEMWTLLYAIDPQMLISINYKTYSIYLQTRPSKVTLVVDVLWWHNPIGVAVFINGERVNFLRKHVEMMDYNMNTALSN